jgi:hypothetical protein
LLYINSKCNYNLSLNKHQKVCEKAQATLIEAIDDLAKARQFFPKKSGPGNGIFPTKKNDFDGVTMEVLRRKREKLANPEMRNLSDVDLEKLLKTGLGFFYKELPRKPELLRENLTPMSTSDKGLP